MTDGYAELIGDNFDSLQECFSTRIPKEKVEFLDKWQKYARENQEGQGYNVSFGGETFQIWSGGSQGNRWVLANEVMQIHIRTADEGWNTSVRYLSQGLWQYGHEEMRARAERIIRAEFIPLRKEQGRWISLSWVHYAFDFYSPSYSKESQSILVAQNMVLTSGVKAGMVFTSKRVETLTIGLNRKGLQIQIYDKNKEIKDNSGKSWMYEIWAEQGYHVDDQDNAKDVWRVEIRFGKEFLLDRNIRTFEEFYENIAKLCCEGLMRRRMVSESFDEKKDRWPLHPLWASLFWAAGSCGQYVPTGRKVTGARLERIDQLKKQIMGTMRSLSVLEHHFYKSEEMKKDSVTMAIDVEFDPDHLKKEQKAVNRYQWIDEAQ